MSEFMTELAKTAEKMGESISKGIDGAKLKWAVMRLKSSLDGCYLELGKYISDHRDTLSEEECIDHITTLYEKIDGMKEDIALLKEALPKSKCVCRACGKAYKKEFGFCPFCGQKKGTPPVQETVPDETPATAEEAESN